MTHRFAELFGNGLLTAAVCLKRRHTPLNCVPFAIEEVVLPRLVGSHRDRCDKSVRDAVTNFSTTDSRVKIPAWPRAHRTSFNKFQISD
jgi:hypothetical protein